MTHTIYYKIDDNDSKTKQQETESPRLLSSVKVPQTVAKQMSSISVQESNPQIQNGAQEIYLKDIFKGLKAAPEKQAASNPIFSSVVRIINKAKTVLPESPWKLGELEELSSTGVAIKVGRKGEKKRLYFLTNGHAVRNCVSDNNGKNYVNLFDSCSNHFKGKVIVENDFSDLSILKPVNEKSVPKAVGDNAIVIDDLESPVDKFDGLYSNEIIAAGYPFGQTSLTVTTGKVTSVGSIQYSLSGVVGPILSTDASLNVGNSGGPMFFKNKDYKLAGIVFQGAGNNFVCGIPMSVVKSTLYRYLYCNKNEKDTFFQKRYEPNVVFETFDPDDTNRSFFQIDQTLSKLGVKSESPLGIRVKSVNAFKNEKSDLMTNDIVYKMNGELINSNGYFIQKYGEDKVPMFFEAMYMLLHDDKPHIDLEVLRRENNKVKNYSIKHRCNVTSDIIPKYVNETSNEYFCPFGVLIEPLSCKDVVEDMTSGAISVDEIQMFTSGKKNLADDQVLRTKKVFADPTLAMFQKCSGLILKEVNGHPVSNILSAIYYAEKLQKTEGETFFTMSFQDGTFFSVPCDDFKKANKTTLKQLGIDGTAYRSKSLDSIASSCSCRAKDCKFDPDQNTVNCNGCNKVLAHVKDSEGSISLLSSSEKVAKGNKNEGAEKIAEKVRTNVRAYKPGEVVFSSSNKAM